MTERWRTLCRDFLLGSLGVSGPLCIYGEIERVRAAVDTLTVGRSLLFPNERMYCGNWALDRMYAEGGKDANGGSLRDYNVFVRNIQEMALSHERGRLICDLFNAAYENNSRILIESGTSPSSQNLPSALTYDRIVSGTVFCVDEERIGKPLEEIAAAGITLPGKKGQFTELYKPDYLRLFSCEPTAELSEEQWRALEMIYHYVRNRTDEDLGRFAEISRIQRENPFLWNAEPEDLPADFIEFEIIYAFWNRFSNGHGERNEVRLAKSGLLGAYLRALKKRDEA